MTTDRPFECADKERLVAYLYGEASAADRAAVAAHLETCAACAAELDALRDVRTSLACWGAPQVELGFRVVRHPVRPTAAGWWRALRPVAVAAAVMLVAAAAAAVAKIELRVGREGLVVRAGASPAPAPASVREGVDRPWRTDLEALEARLRRELATRTPTAVADKSTPDEAALLRRVRAMVEASEARQQRELALRIAQVAAEMQTQRQADLTRLDQRLGQLAGLTGAEVAKQRELMNYLIRVSSRRP